MHDLAFSQTATYIALSPERLGTLYSLVLLVLCQHSHRSYSSGAVVGYLVVHVLCLGEIMKRNWHSKASARHHMRITSCYFDSCNETVKSINNTSHKQQQDSSACLTMRELRG